MPAILCSLAHQVGYRLSESQCRQGCRSINVYRDAYLSPAFGIRRTRRLSLARVLNGVAPQQQVCGKMIGKRILSNIHQIPSLGVDATYYSEMHSALDEGTTKKIQVLSDKCIPGLRK
jgi:hypothetical protein